MTAPAGGVPQSPVDADAGVAAPHAAALPVAAAQPGRLPLTVRLRGALAGAWHEAVPRLHLAARRTGPAGLAGVGLGAIAGVLAFTLLLPLQRQAAALQGQLDALGAAQASLRGGVSNHPEATAGEFLRRFPARGDLPAVLATFSATALAAGVQLEQGTYALERAKGAHLARYRMSFPVKGQYPGIRSFVDNVLVAVPAASLDSLRLERAEIDSGVVGAELQFTVFVREST
jgi:hypothetical protein